jgi:WD40 repeat protein
MFYNTKRFSKQTVNTVAVLGNDRIVSGSSDNTVKIWNTSTGACLQTLTGHSSYVKSVAVLGNDRIVSGSYDKTVKIWNTSTGACLHTLTGHSSYVNTVAVLGNDHIVSGSSDNTVKIWNTSTGACLQTLTGHSSYVNTVAVLGNDHIVSGSYDNTVKIWNTSTGECLQILVGHSGWVLSVAVLGNDHIVSGSWDKTVKIWNTSTGTCLQTLTGHSGWVNSVAVLGNDRIVSGSSDKTVKIWNTSSGACLQTLTGHSSYVKSVAVLGNNRIVSGAEFDNSIFKQTINIFDFYNNDYDFINKTIFNNNILLEKEYNKLLDILGSLTNSIMIKDVRLGLKSFVKDWIIDFIETIPSNINEQKKNVISKFYSSFIINFLINYHNYLNERKIRRAGIDLDLEIKFGEDLFYFIQKKNLIDSKFNEYLNKKFKIKYLKENGTRNIAQNEGGLLINFFDNLMSQLKIYFNNEFDDIYEIVDKIIRLKDYNNGDEIKILNSINVNPIISNSKKHNEIIEFIQKKINDKFPKKEIKNKISFKAKIYHQISNFLKNNDNLYIYNLKKKFKENNLEISIEDIIKILILSRNNNIPIFLDRNIKEFKIISNYLLELIKKTDKSKYTPIVCKILTYKEDTPNLNHVVLTNNTNFKVENDVTNENYNKILKERVRNKIRNIKNNVEPSYSSPVDNLDNIDFINISTINNYDLDRIDDFLKKIRPEENNKLLNIKKYISGIDKLNTNKLQIDNELDLYKEYMEENEIDIFYFIINILGDKIEIDFEKYKKYKKEKNIDSDMLIYFLLYVIKIKKEPNYEPDADFSENMNKIIEKKFFNNIDFDTVYNLMFGFISKNNKKKKERIIKNVNKKIEDIRIFNNGDMCQYIILLISVYKLYMIKKIIDKIKIYNKGIKNIKEYLDLAITRGVYKDYYEVYMTHFFTEFVNYDNFRYDIGDRFSNFNDERYFCANDKKEEFKVNFKKLLEEMNKLDPNNIKLFAKAISGTTILQPKYNIKLLCNNEEFIERYHTCHTLVDVSNERFNKYYFNKGIEGVKKFIFYINESFGTMGIT